MANKLPIILIAILLCGSLLAENIPQGTNLRLTFFVGDGNGVPATGLTLKPFLSKNGGTKAAAAGGVVEIGGGYYALDGNTQDTGTLGSLIIEPNYPAMMGTQNVYWVDVNRDPNWAELTLRLIAARASILEANQRIVGADANVIAVLNYVKTLLQTAIVANDANGLLRVQAVLNVVSWLDANETVRHAASLAAVIEANQRIMWGDANRAADLRAYLGATVTYAASSWQDANYLRLLLGPGGIGDANQIRAQVDAIKTALTPTPPTLVEIKAAILKDPNIPLTPGVPRGGP